jgi:hypothetical protein
MIRTNLGLIGTSFLTGQKAPVTGIYTLIRHVNHTCCCATDDEREISLKEGEPFPPHCGCGKRVIWQLSQYSWISAGTTCSFIANINIEPTLRATTS